MNIERQYTTEGDDLPSEIIPEHTYYNSWDGELFTVVSVSPDGQEATIAYHTGAVELVGIEEIEVDFNRIHPVKPA